MPPTLVRPQTFDPFQSPDSASPAVRFQQKLLGTCCLDILPRPALFWLEPYISSFQGALYLLLGFRFSVREYCLTS